MELVLFGAVGSALSLAALALGRKKYKAWRTRSKERSSAVKVAPTLEEGEEETGGEGAQQQQQPRQPRQWRKGGSRKVAPLPASDVVAESPMAAEARAMEQGLAASAAAAAVDEESESRVSMFTALEPVSEEQLDANLIRGRADNEGTFASHP